MVWMVNKSGLSVYSIGLPAVDIHSFTSTASIGSCCTRHWKNIGTYLLATANT